MKHPFFYLLMAGLLAATFAFPGTDTEHACDLARKTGGAPARLQEKQQRRYKGTSQNQPDQRMARKVGGYKPRLLHRQHTRYRRAAQV